MSSEFIDLEDPLLTPQDRLRLQTLIDQMVVFKTIGMKQEMYKTALKILKLWVSIHGYDDEVDTGWNEFTA